MIWGFLEESKLDLWLYDYEIFFPFLSWFFNSSACSLSISFCIRDDPQI
jgi:hypothetical protein